MGFFSDLCRRSVYNNNNLFHVLIDPDTGIDTIQGYRMSHKFKTLVSIVIN
jgi:hypothetical protein